MKHLAECVAGCGPKAKYKCPKCKAAYCKPSCFKAHDCQPQKQVPQPVRPEEDFKLIKSDFLEEEELRLPLYKLRRLRNNPAIKEMLKRPELRAAILEIDNSKQRTRSLLEHQSNPSFQSFSDTVLKTLGVVDQEGAIS